MKVARRLIVPLLFAMVGCIALVFAASNIITLQHTATVTTGGTLGALDEGSIPLSTGCPTTANSYGTGPVNIAWGIVAQGETVKHYVCVINTGTAPDTLSISGNPPAGYGTISSPQQSATLPANGAVLGIELDWVVPTGATTGPVTFPTSIT
ncbi:MAG TPA: hypothetical protein VEL52_02135 [Candidatus Bathyarchaeia archaeon]|nr:hypothetical protein [Candidatus Bathyarchaeia archaeon]